MRPNTIRKAWRKKLNVDIGQNSDHVINLNELGVDLEKTINSKIANRYIMSENKIKTLQLATFAAGCFWGIEESFGKIKGVKSTMVGYTGGRGANPTYRDVCTDLTGHAEAIQLQYDPQEVSYEELLKVFWSIHDPTTKNRQGPDVGSQYRLRDFLSYSRAGIICKKISRRTRKI